MKGEIIKMGGQEKSLIKQDRTMAICLSSGVNIEITQEEYQRILISLEDNEKRLIKVGGQLINTAFLIGILHHDKVDEVQRKKQWQWQDKDGNWWGKEYYECTSCGRPIPKGMKCGICAR